MLCTSAAAPATGRSPRHARARRPLLRSCGGTICKLGTKKHHDAYLDGIDSLALPGCFGMTELGHGSNVMGIETTVRRSAGGGVLVTCALRARRARHPGRGRAPSQNRTCPPPTNPWAAPARQATYDPATGEFVINTPTNEASKYWIGGSGQHGKICTVFAQLTVDGKWEGPHVFVVRLRDDGGAVMPGVRIKDHGPKMGLNGVDNGQIWFDNVRVSRCAAD